MNTPRLWTILIIIGLVSLGLAGLAYAEGDPPTTGEQGWCQPMGHPMGAHMWSGMRPHMGPQMGAMMGGAACPAGSTMHDAMLAALAEGLGLSPEDLAARLEAGQRPPQIAAELGLSPDAWFEVMAAAHEAAWAASQPPGNTGPAGWHWGKMPSACARAARGPMMRSQR